VEPPRRTAAPSMEPGGHPVTQMDAMRTFRSLVRRHPRGSDGDLRRPLHRPRAGDRSHRRDRSSVASGVGCQGAPEIQSPTMVSTAPTSTSGRGPRRSMHAGLACTDCHQHPQLHDAREEGRRPRSLAGTGHEAGERRLRGRVSARRRPRGPCGDVHHLPRPPTTCRRPRRATSYIGAAEQWPAVTGR